MNRIIWLMAENRPTRDQISAFRQLHGCTVEISMREIRLTDNPDTLTIRLKELEESDKGIYVYVEADALPALQVLKAFWAGIRFGLIQMDLEGKRPIALWHTKAHSLGPVWPKR